MEKSVSTGCNPLLTFEPEIVVKVYLQLSIKQSKHYDNNKNGKIGLGYFCGNVNSARLLLFL
ncbi:MAG: hypothetical protein PHW11_00360 [Anaerolineaceae bacterium]|nr:hypothetical protein [Anaerolineaceae bacterium]MDD4042195.1 hypothetical protein [Anaerolineaceae bacterium]MDD4577031.1 hypothetical protein [Anaerolineaceae bacterium]